MMELFKISLVLLISSCSSKYFVASHSYHFGQCPTLEPMADFSMENVSHINNCKHFVSNNEYYVILHALISDNIVK